MNTSHANMIDIRQNVNNVVSGKKGNFKYRKPALPEPRIVTNKVHASMIVVPCLVESKAQNSRTFAT